MKNITIILLLTILCSGSVLGQSKKDVQYRASQLEKQLNEEKAAHKTTKTTLKRYEIMYDAIREKVLPYDFKPENTSAIIDSLHMNRDSTLMNIKGESYVMADQIDSLTITINSQQTEIDSLSKKNEKLAEPMPEISEKQITELKKIKELMDSGILTETEFNERKKGILKQE